MPGFVDAGASGNQQAGDVPAAVANGVVEGSADRAIGLLDIGSAAGARTASPPLPRRGPGAS
jgi:hypothetical protein